MPRLVLPTPLIAAPWLATSRVPARRREARARVPARPARGPARLFGLAIALVLGGCVHKVQVVSDPAGASVLLGDRRLGPSPVEVPVPLFGARDLTVQLAGYRPLAVRVPWGFSSVGFVGDVLTLHWGRALGHTPYARMELRLVPEHGGVGTWDQEDVP